MGLGGWMGLHSLGLHRASQCVFYNKGCFGLVFFSFLPPFFFFGLEINSCVAQGGVACQMCQKATADHKNPAMGDRLQNTTFS